MSGTFGFESYKEHDFFHLRYGRGAVIVAIDKENKDAIYASGIFNSRDRHDRGSGNLYFDEIISIKEIDGFVRVTIVMKHRQLSQPEYKPLDCTIERILPINSVTFEVVRDAEIGQN